MRPGLCALALTLATTALTSGCRTSGIVNDFNDGAHGTEGDPSTPRRSRGRAHVAALLRDTLTRGFYRDYKSCSRELRVARDYFPKAVLRAADLLAKRSATGLGTRLENDEAAKLFDESVSGISLPWRPKPPPAVCSGDGQSLAAHEFLDHVRFQVAYVRAIETAARWYREGLVDLPNLKEGTTLGFDEVDAYLAHRTWFRDDDRPVRGLVVSGGSSNGMFSAGVVWFTLNVISKVMADPARPPKSDPRFQIISGTSAGAMIATAVDLYNRELDDYVKKPGGALPTRALDQISYWFTCLPANQLYCVDDDSTLSLFTNRTGVVRFDGIRKVLVHALDDSMLTNSSELLLNTVDFQTGEVIALSDQDPYETRSHCDVVDHALASIPLPLIAQPYPVERVQGKRRPGFYLDGGVRATLPLLPLARRGAEKVLLVSSSASVVSGDVPPQNALDLLKRYTSLEAGNTTEEGVAFASALAQLIETEERDACCRAYDPKDGCHGPTDAAAFCDGRFTCSAGKFAPSTKRRRPSWQLSEVYRDEVRVPEAAGYSFDPRESLPLFLAGMASARSRCAELLSFFDLDPARTDLCEVRLPTPRACEGHDDLKPFPSLTGTASRKCDLKVPDEVCK